MVIKLESWVVNVIFLKFWADRDFILNWHLDKPDALIYEYKGKGFLFFPEIFFFKIFFTFFLNRSILNFIQLSS